MFYRSPTDDRENILALTGRSYYTAVSVEYFLLTFVVDFSWEQRWRSKVVDLFAALQARYLLIATQAYSVDDKIDTVRIKKSRKQQETLRFLVMRLTVPYVGTSSSLSLRTTTTTTTTTTNITELLTRAKHQHDKIPGVFQVSKNQVSTYCLR